MNYAGGPKTTPEVLQKLEISIASLFLLLIMTLTYPDASYISVHFSSFDLPSSCVLAVTDGKEAQYTMTGKGKHDLGTFWARHVKGDTIEMTLSCKNDKDKDLALFEIDQFAAGYPLDK